MNNDKFGDDCQKIVLDYLTQTFNAFAKSKGTKGYDLIVYHQNKELKFEIKGMSQFFRNIQINNFQINTTHLKKDLTHFAFITQDDVFIPNPILFLTPAKQIFDYIKNESKSKTHKHTIPLRWIRNNIKPIYLKNIKNKEGKK